MFPGGKRKPSFKMVSNMVIQLLHSIKYSVEVPFSNMAQQPVEIQKNTITKKVWISARSKTVFVYKCLLSIDLCQSRGVRRALNGLEMTSRQMMLTNWTGTNMLIYEKKWGNWTGLATNFVWFGTLTFTLSTSDDIMTKIKWYCSNVLYNFLDIYSK